MSSADISRKLFQPAKHYAGTVYQQGRVTLDSDQNENNLLAGEELQRLVALSAEDEFAPDRVLEGFAALIKQAPRFAEAYNQRAIVYFRLGDLNL